MVRMLLHSPYNLFGMLLLLHTFWLEWNNLYAFYVAGYTFLYRFIFHAHVLKQDLQTGAIWLPLL